MPKHDFDFPSYHAAHEVESDTSEAGASLNPCLNLIREGGCLL
jgi:hypothetical protein